MLARLLICVLILQSFSLHGMEQSLCRRMTFLVRYVTALLAEIDECSFIGIQFHAVSKNSSLEHGEQFSV